MLYKSKNFLIFAFIVPVKADIFYNFASRSNKKGRLCQKKDPILGARWA
ncbi:hypothetical protein HMPREF9136_1513 [Prevotella dentalis DSM 3688]|uniref:Uncharacterized protein n=1 Tax=Prevotella dentalis (strain ATCC 49559 / DSM 3688 / JCM 13448 / NCTC 12043 / ES 2772) TaxID=908937 RepID=F9D3T5_PREDD|nr:hypothetical protein HMPREF9136_1513 [Prevotella dentalis DSM 3688]